MSSTGSVSPFDYQAAGNGTTDDKAAWTQAIATGKPIDLSDGDYKITAGDLRAGANDLILTGHGRIRYPRNQPALTFAPTLGPAKTIVAFANVQHPAGLGVAVTRVQVSPGQAAGLIIGDKCVFRSTTKMGWGVTPAEDAGRGEAAQVIDINAANNWVYLNRILQWVGTPAAFDGVATAGNTCRALGTQKLWVGPGVEFECYEDVTVLGARHRGAVLIIGAREPEFYGKINSSPTRGLVMVGCYRGHADFWAKNCHDDTTRAAYGYGGVQIGACYACHMTVRAENVRHPVDTNTYPDVSDAYAGAPLEASFEVHATKGSASVLDNHAGALRARFRFGDAHGMAPSAVGSQRSIYMVQDRALETEVDFAGAPPGSMHGIYTIPQAPPAGANSFRNAAGAVLRKYENRYRNVHLAGGQVEAAVLGAAIVAWGSQGGANSQFMRMFIEHSSFRGMTPVFSAIHPELWIVNSDLIDCPTFRCGGNMVTILHCNIVNTAAGAKEAVTFGDNAIITLAHNHFHGAFVTSLARKISGAGSAALFAGYNTHRPAGGAPLPLRSAAAGTIAFTDIQVPNV